MLVLHQVVVEVEVDVIRLGPSRSKPGKKSNPKRKQKDEVEDSVEYHWEKLIALHVLWHRILKI